MNYWEVIILALIQGLTEFLPVSSSGHLVLAHYLFDIQVPALTFDVVLHAGTLAAILLVYRKDLLQIIKEVMGALAKGPETIRQDLKKPSGIRMVYLIGMANIPTAIIGVFFRDQFEILFQKPAWVGLFLMILGVALWFSGCKKNIGKKDLVQTTVWMALLIGLVQGLAIIPGISRSGSTIITALFLGMRSSWSARFSFLMSIPAIMGAAVLQLAHANVQDFNLLHIVLGFLIAQGVGIVALKVVIQLVERGKFRVFSYYVFPLGLLGWVYFSFFV